MYNYQIGSAYSFSVFPDVLLGNNFNNLVVNSVMDAVTAQTQIDINGLWAQYYPYLPSGTVNDPTKTNYVKFTTSTGNVIILAALWIDESTITVVTAQSIVVTIANVGPSDVARVKNALVANGYNNTLVVLQ